MPIKWTTRGIKRWMLMDAAAGKEGRGMVRFRARRGEEWAAGARAGRTLRTSGGSSPCASRVVRSSSGLQYPFHSARIRAGLGPNTMSSRKASTLQTGGGGGEGYAAKRRAKVGQHFTTHFTTHRIALCVAPLGGSKEG